MKIGWMNYLEVEMVKSKKGQMISDIVIIIIILFLFAAVAVIYSMVQSELNDSIQADDDMSSDAKQISQDATDTYPSSFDYMFMILLIGLWVVALITSFFIDTHPIFFGITVFLLGIILAMPVYLSNIYSDIIITDSDLSVYAANFPKINFVMDNYLQVIIVVAVTVLIALYAKMRQ